jgi:hypothetical protein
MALAQGIVDWLLDSDPAIRWQVMRDVLQADSSVYTRARERLVEDGWCAELLRLQGPDGLWNRSLYNGKWVSTTYTLYLLKLLGLPPRNRQALQGCDRLVVGGLYYLDSGRPIEAQWTLFSFPPYWFYDALTTLDYFHSFGTVKDGRMQAGIDLLLSRRTVEGAWLLGARHPGKTYFEMEEPARPSRWNTLRALRVLHWWGDCT